MRARFASDCEQARGTSVFTAMRCLQDIRNSGCAPGIGRSMHYMQYNKTLGAIIAGLHTHLGSYGKGQYQMAHQVIVSLRDAGIGANEHRFLH